MLLHRKCRLTKCIKFFRFLPGKDSGFSAFFFINIIESRCCQNYPAPCTRHASVPPSFQTNKTTKESCYPSLQTSRYLSFHMHVHAPSHLLLIHISRPYVKETACRLLKGINGLHASEGICIKLEKSHTLVLLKGQWSGPIWLKSSPSQRLYIEKLCKW